MRATIVTGSMLVVLIGIHAVHAADGEKVYNQYCMACHAQGVAGAPQFGDKEAWAGRLEKDLATLYEHAINGFQGEAGVMPPKGGFANLSDEQVKAGVDYMVENAR